MLLWDHKEHSKSPHHSEYLDEVEDRLAHTPETWHQYKDKPQGWAAILDMEYTELEHAYKAHRDGKGTDAAVDHELIDVAAAAIHAMWCLDQKA